MGKKEKTNKEYEKGDLVLDFFEVVEYIGYEEHEDDNYHRLFSSKKGEYLQSAVAGPTPFKDSEGYEEILRLWNLNIENHKSVMEKNSKAMKEFCDTTEIHQDYKLWYVSNNKINVFDKTMPGIFGDGIEHVKMININSYDLKNKEYCEFLEKYINTIIEKHLESK